MSNARLLQLIEFYSILNVLELLTLSLSLFHCREYQIGGINLRTP